MQLFAASFVSLVNIDLQPLFDIQFAEQIVVGSRAIFLAYLICIGLVILTWLAAIGVGRPDRFS